jgi:hypothetical protein
LAAVVMAVVGAPMSAWASRPDDAPQHTAGAHGVVVVGDVPGRATGFVDRREVLAAIKPAGMDGGPSVHCLIGQPGSGKTQAAAEWLRCRVAGGAELVAWILAESAGDDHRGSGGLGRRCGYRPGRYERDRASGRGAPVDGEHRPGSRRRVRQRGRCCPGSSLASDGRSGGRGGHGSSAGCS